MKKLLSTKEIAQYLSINEKMVYTLIAEKGLPATKITGKWVFPIHLVEQWIETNTDNYPEPAAQLPPYHGLLIITGSNDPLLDKTISLFNNLYPEHVAVFGNMGSMGGLRALRQNLCHMASSHLLADNEKEYNFDFAKKEFDKMPAIVNFCRREQGILIQKENPKGIKSVADLAGESITISNRPLGTGTRLLFDRELEKAGLEGDKINGYRSEFSRHLDAGLEILSGRSDAAPGIRAIAGILDLDFIPLRWERFDLLIPKDRFFDKGVQLFLGVLHEEPFRILFKENFGYDLKSSGKVVYPGNDN
ncbi:MAG: helix-turn-helix transcriptional regulator [Desulfobacterales bacterium]|nr:helix-turn-helix transcriptional regulator [Desulfobacteraceae bacterium]MBT7084614.1 helix-turn-helix transcriptional regulator [Desulfobacterales bacterium]MBT7697896.1 helix-turn-helix transcriptional regulator [Desulfobacterales bacterium]